MIQIKQAVIVEGKYDQIKLASLLDTLIIPTDGFRIFNDKEKQRLIRRLAETRGIVILTDSDRAGFQIRSFLGGSVPPSQVIHAYIPDIFGKEKRKAAPSREGKLGVEGIQPQLLLDALTQAGVMCNQGGQPRKAITKLDLYRDGISGGAHSRTKRSALLKRLELPERLSANALLQVLNSFLDYEEYQNHINALDRTEEC